MKKLIYNRIDKASVGLLKKVFFPGKIFVIYSPSEAEKAVDYLLSQPILGLDTETRPSFEKGKHYKCALLQVATNSKCFLFRLNRIGMCPAVARLLSDKTVTKVGWHGITTCCLSMNWGISRQVHLSICRRLSGRSALRIRVL